MYIYTEFQGYRSWYRGSPADRRFPSQIIYAYLPISQGPYIFTYIYLGNLRVLIFVVSP